VPADTGWRGAGPGPQGVHEINHGGYRVPTIAWALRLLPVTSATIDGEAGGGPARLFRHACLKGRPGAAIQDIRDKFSDWPPNPARLVHRSETPSCAEPRSVAIFGRIAYS